MFEVPKWHKLDNVSKHRLALGRPQDPIIAIQHLHVAKIGVPHPNDDDWHGKVRGMDNGLSGVSHVCDDAIRQNQQDEILLKLLDKKWKIVSLVFQSCLPFSIIKVFRVTHSWTFLNRKELLQWLKG